jgi:cytochrome P450
MLGSASVSMTTDLDMHARLRQQIGASFTKDAILQLLPQLQQTAAVHLERWAAATALSDSSNGGSASAQRQLATSADGSMLLG